MQAGGPAANTRSTRAGTETRRRAESTMLRSPAGWPGRGSVAVMRLETPPTRRARRSITSADPITAPRARKSMESVYPMVHIDLDSGGSNHANRPVALDRGDHDGARRRGPGGAGAGTGT